MGDEELGHVSQLVQDCPTMVTKLQVEVLQRWLTEAKASKIPELCSLAAGIYRDSDAVRNALMLPWSQGQSEAQVHRLKLIKRQAYGRVSCEQLWLRILHGSGVTHQEKLCMEHLSQHKCA